MRTPWTLLFAGLCSAALMSASGDFPEPAADVKPTPGKTQKAVFAGGCFWCTEAVFEMIEGVTGVVSGYSGGDMATATYEQVSTGATGHAEAVEITFDSTKVTYGQLLKVFFSVAHDPTQLNRQGPDRGPQYRSAVFYIGTEQKKATEAYIAAMAKERTFAQPIVTQVVPFQAFYEAESHHQNFCSRNPRNRYVQAIAAPKMDKTKKQYPGMLKR
ncbi:MAG: peptide-methionine (S)-S-oxide reductase MsrA [Bryobacterales bacterium]|nr:peptide-methionine (S)-S-oxide reductase MsrA [Bryobacterales bacterium]